LSKPETFSTMTSEQREAIGLLGIGTFLEYFDLMLYVHMAVLLNEIFFPKTDPFTSSLLSAFAFCSTYVLRPFGALIFGYIGDTIGRKATVIITTILMSISCCIMAILPTYDQIGIYAAWIVTGCRMAQGLCTMGEVIGANVYITEITKPPLQYVSVSLMAIFGSLGGVFSLATAALVTSNGFDWRNAFWIGSGIAIIGAVARTRLRETKDFADAKYRVEQNIKLAGEDPNILNKRSMWRESLDVKTALALFFMECSWPVCFYIAYIHCGNILKFDLGVSSSGVIQNNFILSIIQLFAWLVAVLASYRIYPLNILKFKFIVFCPIMVLLPYLLAVTTEQWQILLMQSVIVSLGFMGTPAMSIFYKRLPIFKRFTSAAFAYALSRAFVYILTSFCLVILTEWFGHYGILIIMIPTAIAYFYGLRHFEKIEKRDMDVRLENTN
jgi:MHS family proline/betaine transporter-like MFS transporter